MLGSAGSFVPGDRIEQRKRRRSQAQPDQQNRGAFRPRLDSAASEGGAISPQPHYRYHHRNHQLPASTLTSANNTPPQPPHHSPRVALVYDEAHFASSLGCSYHHCVCPIVMV